MSNTWVWESTMEPLVGDPFNGFWACLDRVAVNTANKSLEYTNVNYAYFDFELHGMVDQGPNYVGPSIICLRFVLSAAYMDQDLFHWLNSRTSLMISSSGILSSIIFSTQQKSASATKPQFLASDWEAYGETSMEYQIFNPTGMSSYQEYQTFCRSQSGALPILLTNESFQEFKKIIK
uniref:C-type lectin domain-containing protein n=1 Tax=Romanomermis culicivorax TaxID=13658 RepID=A0A915IWI9_ROMCU